MANLQQEMTEASLKETLAQVYPRITGNIDFSYNKLEKMKSPESIEGYNNNLSLSLSQIL